MWGRKEKSIEQKVVDHMWEVHRIDSLKLNLFGNRGYPDREFHLPLRPAWIEFKKPGEEPKKLQQYRIEQMKEKGYDVKWTDNTEDAIQWLESLLTARLSEARNQAGYRSGVCGALLGPRPRKN